MSTSPDFAGGWGEMMRLAPAQLEDNRAVRALPLSIERFRAIAVPALLLRGSDSPAHLHHRLDALKGVIVETSDATIEGEGHTANLTAPDLVADIIARFAARILG
jgi:pimeloyl-ACP methyl ester carboxylesterase